MRKWVLAGFSVVAVGCGVTDPGSVDPMGADEQEIAFDNGRELNGRELNGRELNGRELNGRELNGRELNGRELNGRELNGQLYGSGGSVNLTSISLEGSELVGLSDKGVTYRGTAMAGFEIKGDNATPLELRIQSVKSSQDARIGPVWRYQVTYKSSGDWLPLCGIDPATKQAAFAIPLAGVWDYTRGTPTGGAHFDSPNVITFACEGAALAKCVDFGYAPWASYAGKALASYHQACTRMVRADYCGDGRSFTKSGTPVDLYDGIGIQADTEAWAFEAEWNGEGAICLERRRVPDITTVPDCEKELVKPGCGNLSNFSSGTLLMSEAEKK